MANRLRGATMRIRGWALVAVLPVAFWAAACESGDPLGPEGTARMQVLLKDDPAELIEMAEVWISRVYLVGGGEAPQDLFNDPDAPHHFDLLTLQDGVVADLTGEVEVPAGRYRQLRFVVDSARITLEGGTTFDDGEQTRALKVPGGAQSGIKVLLKAEIDADPGTVTTILVDFDVRENFVIQGNPNSPAGIKGILFTPLLKEVVLGAGDEAVEEEEEEEEEEQAGNGAG